MNSLPILSSIKKYTKTKAHYAHKSLNINGLKRSHPYSVDFLLGCKNKHGIINPIDTFEKLHKSLHYIALFSKKKGSLLIVNTNKDLSNFIENYYQSTHYNNLLQIADLADLSVCYCNEKWVGGFLTNWKQVSKSIHTFMEFSERFENFIVQNNISFPRYKKMNMSFQGLKTEKTIKRPDLIFLINPNDNRHVVEEALSLNIPVIAITDSNTNLLGISFPIPGNSNSVEFVHHCLQWITRIIVKNIGIKNKK